MLRSIECSTPHAMVPHSLASAHDLALRSSPIRYVVPLYSYSHWTKQTLREHQGENECIRNEMRAKWKSLSINIRAETYINLLFRQ